MVAVIHIAVAFNVIDKLLAMLGLVNTPLFLACTAATVLVFAVFAPWIAPYDPNAINPVDMLKPPAFMEGGDMRYLLGTDNLGLDVFAEIVWGARTSVYVSSSPCSVPQSSAFRRD